MSGTTTTTTTSFPDVTLAEQQKPLTSSTPPESADTDFTDKDVVAAARVHNKANNKAISLSSAATAPAAAHSHSKDTVVFVKGTQPASATGTTGTSSSRGVHLSRAQAVLLVLLALLVLTIFVLLTAFVTRELCVKDSLLGGAGGGGGGDDPRMSVSPTAQRGSAAGGGNSSFFAVVTPLEEDGGSPDQHPFSGLRLPRSLFPMHYDLELRVNLKTFTFTGACNISVHVNTSTRHVVFHRNDLTLNESLVRVRSRPHHEWRVVQQHHVTASQFHVLEVDRELPMGLTVQLELGRFSGKIRDDLRGLYQSSYRTADGQVKHLVSSQLQSTDARRVFPCFDEPDFKATFAISIIHQRGYQAFSNMPVKRETTLDSTWSRKDYDTTPVMSTYILAFVVGEFRSRNATIVEKDGRRYSLKVWARPDAFPQTEHALEFGVQTYKFFTRYFGIPDCVPKSDHVAVPDFSGGAMENWGLVIYRESSLLFDPLVSSSSNKYMVSLIVAHEISHTWFGNMATMRWWDDLWLNEGFASSLMYIAMDDIYPQWNVFAIQVVEDIFPVMVKDALITSHPVSTEIRNPEEIQQYFDMISYNKGMAILRMLRHFIGPENFRKGLQSYVKKYKYKNADMNELWQTFTEAVEGKHLIGEIMEKWTRQMGYPMVTVQEAGSTFRLSQTRFLLHHNLTMLNTSHSPFGYKWVIPFTYVTEEHPHDYKMAWLDMGSTTIPKESNGWLLGNYEYQGFYRVMYDTYMWTKLSDQLQSDHTVFPEASRAGLIGDAFSFSRANLLDYDVTLNLTRYLKKEKSYVPWRAFLDSMEFLRGMVAAEGYVRLEQYLRNLVAPVFDTVVASAQGTLPERYLRRVILTIACEVGLEKAVTYAKSMFQNWMKFDDRPPADLSLAVYSVGVREGGVAEWEFVWNRSRSTTVASEKEMLMEALAHTRNPVLLSRYISFIFVPEKIKLQDVRMVMAYFSKSLLGRMVSLHFLQSHWDMMNQRFGQDGFVMREVIQEVTGFVNSDYELENLERLFREKPLKSASKAAENALELIRANIEWKKRNYDKISDWLQHNVT
ncbi:glutamyl aminopeptidase-like [Babylonia areolata]|uniref:glutamyl aminopeptidase-like n=1 Tax=Babylonia areolata TaxID=304850 RepID=UPI003FCF114E